MRKAKDLPIAQLTLRKYEKPSRLSKREAVKRLCLSLGLLQPGDSRDVIVDILHVIMMHKKGLPFGRLEDLLVTQRKKAKLPMVGITPANIHRQLRRLKELFLVEKHLDRYRLSEGMSVREIFEERIMSYYLDSIVQRIREHCDLLEKK